MVNPPDMLIMQAGAVVIVMGDVDEIRRAREEAAHVSHVRAAGAIN
jgi:hypothetical protein